MSYPPDYSKLSACQLLVAFAEEWAFVDTLGNDKDSQDDVQVAEDQMEAIEKEFEKRMKGQAERERE